MPATIWYFAALRFRTDLRGSGGISREPGRFPRPLRPLPGPTDRAGIARRRAPPYHGATSVPPAPGSRCGIVRIRPWVLPQRGDDTRRIRGSGDLKPKSDLTGCSQCGYVRISVRSVRKGNRSVSDDCKRGKRAILRIAQFGRRGPVSGTGYWLEVCAFALRSGDLCRRRTDQIGSPGIFPYVTPAHRASSACRILRFRRGDKISMERPVVTTRTGRTSEERGGLRHGGTTGNSPS